MSEEMDVEEHGLVLSPIWRWPSEGAAIRFMIRAERQKMEIVLRRSDNQGLFDFIVDNSPPLDGGTAPSYVTDPGTS